MKTNSPQSSDAILGSVTEELQSNNSCENETRTPRACCARRQESPSRRSGFGNDSPNRVRFASVLVTAVETRPRTLTEDKPMLYWSAAEIALTRRQVLMQEDSPTRTDDDDDCDRRNHSCRGEEEEREHDAVGRSCDNYSAHVEHRNGSIMRDRANEDTYQRQLERCESSQCLSENIETGDEEKGPHLLAPLLDSEWMESLGFHDALQ